MRQRSPYEMKKLVEMYKEAVWHCKHYNQKSDLWLIKRMFACEFLAASLTPKQRQLYDVLVKQEVYMADQQKIVVPAGTDEKDANKVLKLRKLQSDPSTEFHVTWEGQPGKTKVMVEAKPKYFKG